MKSSTDEKGRGRRRWQHWFIKYGLCSTTRRNGLSKVASMTRNGHSGGSAPAPMSMTADGLKICASDWLMVHGSVEDRDQGLWNSSHYHSLRMHQTSQLVISFVEIEALSGAVEGKGTKDEATEVGEKAKSGSLDRCMPEAGRAGSTLKWTRLLSLPSSLPFISSSISI